MRSSLLQAQAEADPRAGISVPHTVMQSSLTSHSSQQHVQWSVWCHVVLMMNSVGAPPALGALLSTGRAQWFICPARQQSAISWRSVVCKLCDYKATQVLGSGLQQLVALQSSSDLHRLSISHPLSFAASSHLQQARGIGLLLLPWSWQWLCPLLPTNFQLHKAPPSSHTASQFPTAPSLWSSTMTW